MSGDGIMERGLRKAPLPRDGSLPMTGDLDLDGRAIRNAGPTDGGLRIGDAPFGGWNGIRTEGMTGAEYSALFRRDVTIIGSGEGGSVILRPNANDSGSQFAVSEDLAECESNLDMKGNSLLNVGNIRRGAESVTLTSQQAKTFPITFSPAFAETPWVICYPYTNRGSANGMTFRVLTSGASGSGVTVAIVASSVITLTLTVRWVAIG